MHYFSQEFLVLKTRNFLPAKSWKSCQNPGSKFMALYITYLRHADYIETFISTNILSLQDIERKIFAREIPKNPLTTPQSSTVSPPQSDGHSHKFEF